MSYVLFGIGERTLALPLAAVASVERPGRFTAVPFAAPWLRGVTSIRGNIVSVVDMGRFLGGAPAGLTPSARLLVTRGAGKTAALLVDRVGEIVPALDRGAGDVAEIDPSALMGSPSFGAYQQSDAASVPMREGLNGRLTGGVE